MRDGFPRCVWLGRLTVSSVILAGLVLVSACASPAPPAAEPEVPAEVQTGVEPEVADEAPAEVVPAAEPEAAAEPQADPDAAAEETAAVPDKVEPEPPAAKPEPVEPEPSVASSTTERTGEIPDDHVKDRDGAMHKKGSSKAWVKCTPCHGKDLRGKKNRPSCFSCHDNEWDDDD